MNRQLKAQIILKYGSSENFAIAARVSRSKVSRVIHGNTILTPDQKINWASVLDSDVKDIFPEEGS